MGAAGAAGEHGAGTHDIRTVNRAFTKMHGLGNDFVVVDARRESFAPDAATVRAMADRHRGIGFDQLLTLEPARHADSVAAYRIRNADGEDVAQCGNGVRCLGAWLHHEGSIAGSQPAQLDSPAGRVTVQVTDADSVAVDMGVPEFAPTAIPFRAESATETYTLAAAGEIVAIGAVSMGNPHAVVEVEAFDATRLTQLGPALTAHSRFPEGCNAGFVCRRSAAAVDLRVHERGSGWTRACGSGACAAVAVLRQRGVVDAHVAVTLPGGTLTVDWLGADEPLWMTGPAAFVFAGEWPLQAPA